METAITISPQANQQLTLLKGQTYLGKTVNPQIALSKSASELLLANLDAKQRLKYASNEELEMLDNNLIALTGVQFENEQQVDMNYTKYMPLLIDVFGDRTIDEVVLAFKLARAGKLTNHKDEQFVLYRELNFASASDVLLAYDEYKKQELGQYIQNQKLFEQENTDTEAERKKIIECDGLRQFLRESWVLCEQNKLNETTGVLLYDSLRERGLIDLSKEEKIEIQETAKQSVQEIAEYERKEALDTTMYRHWDKLIKTLSGETNEVVLMSKKIALQFQIQKWIMDGTTVEQIEQLIV